MKKVGFNVGILLGEVSMAHLSVVKFLENFSLENVSFIVIDHMRSLFNYPKFDLIIHKSSDFIKPCRANDKNAIRIMNELKNYSSFNPDVIFMDPLETVLGLADRHRMFQIMDVCACVLNGIEVVIPKWYPLVTKNDLKNLQMSDVKYPIICKALCSGEGSGAHEMQLIFHKNQLSELKVFPSIAQEFQNHSGVLYKIAVHGSSIFMSTRPSVRDFPINGCSLEQTDSIRFNSHGVAKYDSFGFLNNYQNGFTPKSSIKGDVLLDIDVVKHFLNFLFKEIKFSLLGIDVLITNNGKTYNIVDINYMPSFDGIPFKEELLNKLFTDIIRSRTHINYWKND